MEHLIACLLPPSPVSNPPSLPMSGCEKKVSHPTPPETNCCSSAPSAPFRYFDISKYTQKNRYKSDLEIRRHKKKPKK